MQVKTLRNNDTPRICDIEQRSLEHMFDPRNIRYLTKTLSVIASQFLLLSTIKPLQVAASFDRFILYPKPTIHHTMATNEPKDSSHKPTVIAGDEEEQLFVLERLTLARQEMNVHKLHVPDLDTLILNRVEALEQNPFRKKRDQDNAAQNVVKDITSANNEKYSFSGQNAVRNGVGDATSADDEENSFSLNRVYIRRSKGKLSESFRGSVSMKFDEEEKMYSVWTPDLSGETFKSFNFSTEEVKSIKLAGRFTVGLYMNGERQVVLLWFGNGKVANAEEFIRRLEEQTGLQVERIDH